MQTCLQWLYFSILLSISSSCFSCRVQFSHHSSFAFSRCLSKVLFNDAISVEAAFNSSFRPAILLVACSSSLVNTAICSMNPGDSVCAHGASLVLFVGSLITWLWCALICSIDLIMPLSSTKNIALSSASPCITTCMFAASYQRSASLPSIICLISEVEAAVGSSNDWAMRCIHAAFKFREFSRYLSPLDIFVSSSDCIGCRRVSHVYWSRWY